jgi:hypothetical protein
MLLLNLTGVFVSIAEELSILVPLLRGIRFLVGVDGEAVGVECFEVVSEYREPAATACPSCLCVAGGFGLLVLFTSDCFGTGLLYFFLSLKGGGVCISFTA